MGEAAKKAMARQTPEDQGRRSDLPKNDHSDRSQKSALKKIQREARRAGSLLTSGGKGGLDPGLVLHVMRRDNFTCKVCNELGNEGNGGIGVHHKYQHITAPKERAKGELATKQGRRNEPSQLTTICAKCHDEVHEEDRAEHPGQPDADEALKEHGE